MRGHSVSETLATNTSLSHLTLLSFSHDYTSILFKPLSHYFGMLKDFAEINHVYVYNIEH